MQHRIVVVAAVPQFGHAAVNVVSASAPKHLVSQ
jgi:hypothetical protein